MNNKIYKLGFFPTPLHKLKNLSNLYPGYNIYIKRDDQTGLASGGNKTRKLEFLIKDAIDKGCDTVFTAGAQQSNHCRQTAAACSVAGLECHLVLRGVEPKVYQGNLLLSRLLGAKIHFTGNDKKEINFEDYTRNLSENNKPYLIPYGGSNIIGAMGFVEAVKELRSQLNEQNISIDYIFFASSSGGTQAGLMLGLELYKLDIELLPVRIDKDETYSKDFEKAILEIVQDGKKLLNIKKEFAIDDIAMNREYNKKDYGILTKNEILAINTLAKNEGILLDPVYTGRAFYGMLNCMKTGSIKSNSNLLFWHTGGMPALFDYAEGLK